MNVYDGVFRPDGLAFIDDEQAKALNNVVLSGDDVLLNITGASVARCCRLPSTYAGGRVNQHVAIIRPKTDLIRSDYLEHLLTSPDTKRKLMGIAGGGATREAITKAAIQTFKIPLPPLEEQKRIAGILDQADALRRLRTRALDKLNTLGQAIFHEMFGDLFDQTDLSSVPPIGKNLLTVTNGMTRRAKTGDTKQDIVLRLKDIREEGVDFSDSSRITVNDKEREKFKVASGDLLFIRVNGNPDYVGRNAVFLGHDESVFFNDHVMRVRANPSTVNAHFLSFVLNSRFGKNQIRGNMKTSAGQHTINQGGLSAIRVPLPAIGDQAQFQSRLQGIANEAHSAETALRHSHNLFASLQHRAFRGEL